MALGIPMPKSFGESLLQGMDTGSNVFSRLMQPILNREEMAGRKEISQTQLAQQMKVHQDNLAIQQMAQARLAQMAPLERHLAELNIQKAEMETDPAKKLAYVNSVMQGIVGMPGAEQTGNPQAQSMHPMSGMGMPSLEEMQNPTTQALSRQSLQQGFGGFTPEQQMKMGLAGIKIPRQDSYHGAARDAYDLERLRQQVGDNSPIYQNAIQAYKASQQNREDLSSLRGRTLGGLKPGERWMYDDAGQIAGKETPLTATERTEYKGRGFFNYVFPIISKGLTPFSGEKSIRNLSNAASQYGANPESTKLIDDWLLAKKLLTVGVVKESSTLGSGKQKATYEQLRDSLNSSDIPDKIGSVIKQFKLPNSAMRLVDTRFQEILNQATKAGEQSIPAFQRQYFKPKEYEGNTEPSVASAIPVIIIDPKGQRFETTEENAAHLPKGWKRG